MAFRTDDDDGDVPCIILMITGERCAHYLDRLLRRAKTGFC